MCGIADNRISQEDNGMKFFAIALATLLSVGIATAQTESPPLIEPLVITDAQLMSERFMSVTAENGREWIEQCEWPAHKSDSMTRIAACLSFLQGARAVASRRFTPENCPVDFTSQSRGTLLTTTYQIARRYPRLSIHKIFRIAFDSVEPGSC
jgi:hypothetical protein